MSPCIGEKGGDQIHGMQPLDIARRHFPPFANELAALIGVGATFEFCKAFGGECLTIPKKPKQDHKMVAVVGFEAAEKICDAYGPGHVEIPRLPGAIQDLHLVLVPGSANETAKRLGCTRRTVVRRRQGLILAGIVAPDFFKPPAPEDPPAPPLDGVLAEIEARSSRAVAVEIFLAFGGESFTVPAGRRGARSALGERVSSEAAETLVDLWPGQFVRVPRDRSAARAAAHFLRFCRRLPRLQVAERIGGTLNSVERLIRECRKLASSATTSQPEEAAP